MPHADKCPDIQNDEDADYQEEHERVPADLVNDCLHWSAETEGQDCRIVEHGHDDIAPNSIEGWQMKIGNIGKYFSHDRDSDGGATGTQAIVQRKPHGTSGGGNGFWRSCKIKAIPNYPYHSVIYLTLL